MLHCQPQQHNVDCAAEEEANAEAKQAAATVTPNFLSTESSAEGQTDATMAAAWLL